MPRITQVVCGRTGSGSCVLTLTPVYFYISLLRGGSGMYRRVCPFGSCAFGPECRVEMNEVVSPTKEGVNKNFGKD